ncbi:hypothetical protein OG21DRAFT_1485691 [Imleria badia]|nr:hypothetical protein OG21DRAFT_1485691 [Imleria badia]
MHSNELINGQIPNVIVFGEAGVGKSSIINLIAGQKLAHTSNDAFGCTFQHQRYHITLDKMTCALWDTAGLDEGDQGTVPSKLAEDNLRELMRALEHSGGIHLIIYCIRGSRLTKALKRNYDLFYVMVCRKKVPVALVVTGLEHRKDEMETWWTANEATLRRNGMRFDAHACVTTLDLEDNVIQQRRSDSQLLLRSLLANYIRLPAWKTNPSFMSQVLPMFHRVFRGTSNTTTIRNVITCDSFTESTAKRTRMIGNRQYEFLQVDKSRLTSRTLEEVGGVGAGALVFYTSLLVDDLIPQTDVDALKMFYDCAGGQTCPVIVALWGCDDEKVAQACSVQVASHHSDIRAHFVSFPSTDDARAKLDEMIDSLCIEQVKVKARGFLGRFIASIIYIYGLVNAPSQKTVRVS